MNNENAKACLAKLRKQIDEIDNELSDLVEKLVEGSIFPTMAQVREIDLKKRREILQNQFNAVKASIKHF